MSQSQPNVQDLLAGAVAGGELSQAAVQSFSRFGMVNNIQAGLGTPFADVDVTESVLVAVLIDDSGSIASAQNEDNIIKGHNELFVSSLKDSKQRDGILMYVGTLNSGIICPYTPVVHVPLLDRNNYRPQGSTPLCQRIYELLGTIAAKVQDAELNGTNCRSVSVIISDGGDNASTVTPAQVKVEIEKLLATEKHLFLAVGVEDGMTDYTAFFTSLGIPAHCILTVGNSQSEYRRAFLVTSRSVTRASQSAALHSQVAKVGFGAANP